MGGKNLLPLQFGQVVIVPPSQSHSHISVGSPGGEVSVSARAVGVWVELSVADSLAAVDGSLPCGGSL